MNGGADYIHYAYDLDKNTVDVLFFGSSHAYHSISSNKLWGDFGIPAAVLGSSSQPFSDTYYLMKDFLKYQKPKVIVLEVFSTSYTKPYTQETRLRQALDAMPMSLTKLEAIHDICKDFSFTHKMAYLFPISLYHSRWKELRKHDFISDRTFLRGSQLTLEYRDYSEYEPKKNKYNMSEIIDYSSFYLQKIVDLTKENDIPLLFYSSPVARYKERNYKRYYRANLAVEEFAKEQDVPYLFLEKMGDIEFDYSKDFKDSEHTNYYGMAKVTDYIGRYLKEQYDLPDRRDDKKYSSYQMDYEKYLKLLDEKLSETPDGRYMGLPGQAVIEDEE